jgi:hypothetical protein
MTPQEKAKELIAKFSPLVTTWDCDWDEPRNKNDTIVDAKRCALISIDETIEELKGFDSLDGYSISRIGFLNDVKSELSK